MKLKTYLVTYRPRVDMDIVIRAKSKKEAIKIAEGRGVSIHWIKSAEILPEEMDNA